MRGLWRRWKAWQADPDWLWWQRLAPIPIVWVALSCLIGLLAVGGAAALHDPAWSQFLRYCWLGAVIIAVVLVFLFRKRIVTKYIPPVEFPPPPKEKRKRAACRNGLARGSQPGTALFALIFECLLIPTVFLTVSNSFLLIRAFNIVRSTIFPLLAVSIFFGIAFYRLGVDEYNASLERLLYPETKRVAELRERMAELSTNAAAAEALVQEVVGLQEQLADAIGLRQRNIDELIKREQEHEGVAAIQEEKLEVLFRIFDNKGASGRVRERLFNIGLSVASLIVGFFLSSLLPPDTVAQLFQRLR